MLACKWYYGEVAAYTDGGEGGESIEGDCSDREWGRDDGPPGTVERLGRRRTAWGLGRRGITLEDCEEDIVLSRAVYEEEEGYKCVYLEFPSRGQMYG